MSELVPTLRPEDLAHCKRLLAAGSKSFSMAAKLLPADMREDAAVFYAFCRVADDLVDDGDDPEAAHAELVGRLDRIYADQPIDDPVDRSLHAIIRKHDLPRAPFDGLLEGFAWDAEEREYNTLSDVLGYSARVASAVGVVMTMMMGVRDRQVLARACDLGAAMQLTNITRDVAEDAERGRCYLPAEWLEAEGVDWREYVKNPSDHPAVRKAMARLLDEADRLYARSEGGMPHLPKRSRAAIYAARLIYCDIGRVIRERDHNPMAGRAFVGFFRKAWLAMKAFFGSRTHLLATRFRLELREKPLDEMLFLLPASEGT